MLGGARPSPPGRRHSQDETYGKGRKYDQAAKLDGESHGLEEEGVCVERNRSEYGQKNVHQDPMKQGMRDWYDTQ
jgi:hypothetical protein